eukprot:scaffold2092_cov150-Pinguiococcus_pyrenoidosus.AAC.1
MSSLCTTRLLLAALSSKVAVCASFSWKAPMWFGAEPLRTMLSAPLYNLPFPLPPSPFLFVLQKTKKLGRRSEHRLLWIGTSLPPRAIGAPLCMTSSCIPSFPDGKARQGKVKVKKGKGKEGKGLHSSDEPCCGSFSVYAALPRAPSVRAMPASLLRQTHTYYVRTAAGPAAVARDRSSALCT